MVTTSGLQIFLDVERLAPAYDANLWFALNVTVAFTADAAGATAVDEALVRAYLRPWIWEWDKIQVIGVTGDTMQPLAAPVDLVPLGAATPPELIESLGDELSAVLKLGDFTQFIWSPTGSHATETLAEKTRQWRGVLSHASTYPADLGHHAGLVRFFTLPAGTAFDEILIAPIFDVLARNAANAVIDMRSPDVPTGADCLTFPAAKTCPVQRLRGDLTRWEAGDTLDGILYSWRYTAAAGRVDVSALQPRCTVAPATASGELVDMQTLWLDRSAITPGTDWLEQVEHRAAQALDLAQRMLEAGREGLKQTLPIVPDKTFDDTWLAVLHDQADIGQLVPPDSFSLVKDVIQRIAKAAPSVPNPERLGDYVTSYLDPASFTMDRWKDQLADVLSTQRKQGLPAVPAANASVDQVNAYLTQLEALRLALADEDVIAALLLRQWREAVEAAQPTPQFPTPIRWSDVSTIIADFLGSNPLRPRLLLASAGTGWQALTDFTDKTRLAPQLGSALDTYYQARFVASAMTDYGQRVPRPAAPLSEPMNTFIRNRLTDATRTQQSAAEVMAGAAPDLREPTLLPDGMRLQMAKPVALAASTFDARLRGACIMMRRPGDPWSVLNLAQYSVRGEAIPGEAGPALDPTRIFAVPTQIAYRNGLRQVHAVYRNRPIAGRNPAGRLSRKRELKPTAGALVSADLPGVFELWSPYGPAAQNRPRLPRLVFGQHYDVAGFAIGLAGHLPRELADPAKPWRLKTLSPIPDPPLGSVATVEYRRTETVSTLRVQASAILLDPPNAKAIDSSWIPAIPPQVYPLARRQQDAAVDDDLPLVLLTDASNAWVPARANPKAQFFLRPPSINWTTWDAWSDPQFTDVRGQVIAKYHEFADLRDSEDKSSRADLTIDDPAVGGFSAELQSWPAGTPVAPATSMTFKRDVTNPDLKPVQATPIRVTLTSGAQAAIAPAADGLTITVPAGQVLQLVLTPTPVAGAQGKFRNELWPNADPPVSLFTPTKMLIEVATPLPEQTADLAKALHNSLKPACDPPPDAISVAFVPTPELTPLVPHLHRADLMVQRWRWQGRPLFWQDGTMTQVEFPFTRTDADPTLLPKLDGVLFGDRDADDYLVTGARIDVGHDVAKPMEIYRHDVSTSPQAMYYRFAIRVYSRYEGLLRTRASLSSREVPAPAGSAVKPAEQWQRLVVKCRRKTRPRPPVVKLVVPLTQARIGTTEETPGWLVVLEEPWQQFAGLAEGFSVEIVPTRVPGSTQELQEAGPDPMNTLLPAAGAPVFTFTPVGPIGYTFDTDTDAPLFVRAAFFVPAPAITGEATPRDLSGFFYKLRFKRRFVDGGLLSTITDPSTGTLDSDATDPIEAQLLSAFDVWDTDHGRRHVGELRYNGAKQQIVLATDPTTVVVIKPSAANQSPHNKLDLFGLHTDGVTDAFGRADQEVVRGGGLTPLLTASAPVTRYLRIVEVQRPASVQTRGTLLDDLFPGNSDVNTMDAVRRIVRVSPRIEPLVS